MIENAELDFWVLKMRAVSLILMIALLVSSMLSSVAHTHCVHDLETGHPVASQPHLHLFAEIHEHHTHHHDAKSPINRSEPADPTFPVSHESESHEADEIVVATEWQLPTSMPRFQGATLALLSFEKVSAFDLPQARSSNDNSKLFPTCSKCPIYLRTLSIRC